MCYAFYAIMVQNHGWCHMTRIQCHELTPTPWVLTHGSMPRVQRGLCARKTPGKKRRRDGGGEDLLHPNSPSPNRVRAGESTSRTCDCERLRPPMPVVGKKREERRANFVSSNVELGLFMGRLSMAICQQKLASSCLPSDARWTSELN